MVTDVYLVDAAGGEPRRLTQGGGTVGAPSWSPDGSRLAVDRYAGVFDDPKHSQVALVDPAGGDFTLLTAALDLNCSTYPGMREPLWDGDGLVFVAEDHGRVHVYRVAAGGSGAPRLLVGGERVVTGLDVAAGRLVFTASEPARLSELYDGGPAGGQDDPRRRPPPHRRRRRLRRRSRARPARALHRRLGRRQRGRRLDHAARRLRAGQEVPHPAQHPRRALRPVRRRLLRRVPGVLRRRLRGRLQQPARLLRRHRGVGAGHPRPRRARPGLGLRGLRGLHGRGGRGGPPLRLRRRGPPRGHRRLLRRLHDLVGRRPHRPLQGRRVRARRQQLRLAVGVQRLRLGLQGLHGLVPLRGRGRVPPRVARRPTRRTSTRRCSSCTRRTTCAAPWSRPSTSS